MGGEVENEEFGWWLGWDGMDGGRNIIGLWGDEEEWKENWNEL